MSPTCVRVCVCVCLREREFVCEFECVCVCVCVADNVIWQALQVHIQGSFAEI